MADPVIPKATIESVFQRLRGLPANKSCFDCNAKNPTWASVTYGVVICIDCSAVHRGLGVHVSFVRSTQLDTNWTWLQLCAMQVGGNANALQFFAQHNCMTSDAQKKYSSRASQLYREKLYQLALKASESRTLLHSEPPPVEDKTEDFFAQQVKEAVPDSSYFDSALKPEPKTTVSKPEPNVDFNLTPCSTDEKKSTIASRKKPGLGGKKMGLGATKVKANFADLEKEAALAEEQRFAVQQERSAAALLTAKEQEERNAALRLAYKDITVEHQKREEQLKKVDPQKAEQLERLGMGFNSRTGVSHSALSDMKTIEQENDHASLSAFGKLRLTDGETFFDEYSYGMNRNLSKTSDLLGDSSSLESWLIVDETPVEKFRSASHTVERKPAPVYDSGTTSDAARKKFGSAKAISSDQFFNERSSEHEQANLSRFQGSSSISSAEYFGTGKDNLSNSKFQTPDFEDVKDSVRQGVTKVAGKISSLANGVVSSIQERYGY